MIEIPISNPDNVIPFRIKKRSPDDLPKQPAKKGQLKERPRVFCTSHYFVLDDHTRTVECEVCKKVFDGFDALMDLTHDWTNYAYTHRSVRQEIADLKVEKEKLAKQVRNLKSQRRRLLPLGLSKAIATVRSEMNRRANVLRELPGAEDLYKALRAAEHEFEIAGADEAVAGGAT